MKRGDAYPSTWLKSDDLLELGTGPDGDYTVTIKSCRPEEIGQGDDKEIKPILRFQETDKGLVLNPTNWDTIEILYGPDSDDWIGHKVRLWVDTNVKYAGKRVKGIRVRDWKPAQTQNGGGDTWGYKQAVAESEKRGISEKAMRGYLKTKGFQGYNSVACTPILREWFAKLEPPQGTQEPEVSFEEPPDEIPETWEE